MVDENIVRNLFTPSVVEARRLGQTTDNSPEMAVYPSGEMITLGTRQFEIGPLKLRFLRKIEADTAKFLADFPNLTAQERTDRHYDRLVSRVTMAIQSYDPEFSEDLNDMTMTYPQLKAASEQVDRVTGLAQSGEVQGSASAGETSTAA